MKAVSNLISNALSVQQTLPQQKSQSKIADDSFNLILQTILVAPPAQPPQQTAPPQEEPARKNTLDDQKNAQPQQQVEPQTPKESAPAKNCSTKPAHQPASNPPAQINELPDNQQDLTNAAPEPPQEIPLTQQNLSSSPAETPVAQQIEPQPAPQFESLPPDTADTTPVGSDPAQPEVAQPELIQQSELSAPDSTLPVENTLDQKGPQSVELNLQENPTQPALNKESGADPAKTTVLNYAEQMQSEQTQSGQTQSGQTQSEQTQPKIAKIDLTTATTLTQEKPMAEMPKVQSTPANSLWSNLEPQPNNNTPLAPLQSNQPLSFDSAYYASVYNTDSVYVQQMQAPTPVAETLNNNINADATQKSSIQLSTLNPVGDIEQTSFAANSLKSQGKTSFANQIDRMEMIQKIVNATKANFKNGAANIKMLLHPPQLGTLKLNLTVKNSSLSASLVTENQAARHAILNNLDALKQNLENQGINVAQFDVSVDQDWQPPAQQEQDQPYYSALSDAPKNSQPDPEMDWLISRNKYSTSKLVDVLV